MKSATYLSQKENLFQPRLNYSTVAPIFSLFHSVFVLSEVYLSRYLDIYLPLPLRFTLYLHTNILFLPSYLLHCIYLDIQMFSHSLSLPMTLYLPRYTNYGTLFSTLFSCVVQIKSLLSLLSFSFFNFHLSSLPLSFSGLISVVLLCIIVFFFVLSSILNVSHYLPFIYLFLLLFNCSRWPFYFSLSFFISLSLSFFLSLSFSLSSFHLPISFAVLL